MTIGVVGRKCGMTRIFTEEGVSIPVTVIEIEPNRVTQFKTEETDGYRAVQVTVGERRASRVTAAQAGHFAKVNVAAGRGVWEFRLEEGDFQAGDLIKAELFTAGQLVDVTGQSKVKASPVPSSVGTSVVKTTPTVTLYRTVSLAPSASARLWSCIQGQEDVRSHGRRARDCSVHGSSTRRRRTQPAAGQGCRSRRYWRRRGCASSCQGSRLRETDMQLNVNDAQAIEVSELTFGGEFNETLVHQAVVAYMAGGRQGTKQQKTRSDVAGGGKRPWRQKGTGRARAGTTRGPIWRGGGVTFAARPQDHSQKLNKKMYRAALRSILSELVRSERLVVVQDFAVEAPKTKDLLNKLNGMGLNDVLIVSDAVDQNLYLAARNLPHVDVRDVQGSDPVSLIAYEKVLITVSAVKKFEELLG